MSVRRVERKTGRAYEVRWREHGRNRARTFKRKDDADTWDREVGRRKKLGPLAMQQLTARGPTLSQWVQERWAPEHGAALEQATRARYANSYELHIEPWLGDVTLRELTVRKIRDWQAQRLQAGVSAHAIMKCRTVLSSILRHAAESEAIAANPVSLVRAPKSQHRDAVKPIAPPTVERIRAAMLDAAPREVAASRPGQRNRRRHVQPPRPEIDRRRDALIVSILAYSGIRPAECRGLRWGDVGERTIHIQRAANPDGTAKATKTRRRRSVRLLAPLAADLREWRMASGRPADSEPIIARGDGKPWTVEDLGNWRSRQWAQACAAAGLEPAPTPYALRHSFASLLLAEGRNVHYVAQHLGHSPSLCLDTYGHLFAEYADADHVDAEAEIAKARSTARTRLVRASGDGDPA